MTKIIGVASGSGIPGGRADIVIDESAVIEPEPPVFSLTNKTRASGGSLMQRNGYFDIPPPTEPYRCDIVSAQRSPETQAKIDKIKALWLFSGESLTDEQINYLLDNNRYKIIDKNRTRISNE